jgi:hypothetical protein
MTLISCPVSSTITAAEDCGLIARRFGETRRFHLLGSKNKTSKKPEVASLRDLTFDPEDGGDMFL